MKKNGKLTKAEEKAVYHAFDIIDAWVDAHMEDKALPPNFWDIYNANRELKNCAWAMTDQG